MAQTYEGCERIFQVKMKQLKEMEKQLQKDRLRCFKQTVGINLIRRNKVPVPDFVQKAFRAEAARKARKEAKAAASERKRRAMRAVKRRFGNSSV